MSFTNKYVLDLVKSVGLPETVKHLVELPINASDANAKSINSKIGVLRKKLAQLLKNASTGKPAHKRALEEFYAATFELPLRDDSKRPR